MTNPQPRILDDLTRIAGGAVNVLSGVSQQIRSEVKARVEEMASKMDLVPREDLDRVEALVQKLHADQKELTARIDELEKTQTAKKKKA